MRAAALTVALAIPVVAALPTSATAADGLTATATPNSGKPGAIVMVTGANWPSAARLQLVTCGGLAIGGSPSCDLAATYTLIASATGAFSVQVKLGKPPVPCPCVIHVSDADSTAAVDIPVIVVGQPVAPPPTPTPGGAVPAVVVVNSDLTGWGPWTALFGAGPQRTLALTLRNTTSAAIPSTPLQLVDGPTATSGKPLLTTQVGPIGPHEAKAFFVPVSLNPGVGGRFTITGTLGTGTSFTATTTSYAWGFYILDVILLVILILVIVGRIRARRATPGPEATGPDAGVPEDQGPASAGADDNPVPFPMQR